MGQHSGCWRRRVAVRSISGVDVISRSSRPTVSGHASPVRPNLYLSRAAWPRTRKPLGGGQGRSSRSMSIDGAAITGTDRDNPLTILNYQYLAASEPQITGGSGVSPQTETLTDVLHYYWSHDLRPGPGIADLRNSIFSLHRATGRSGSTCRRTLWATASQPR